MAEMNIICFKIDSILANEILLTYQFLMSRIQRDFDMFVAKLLLVLESKFVICKSKKNCHLFNVQTVLSQIASTVIKFALISLSLS